MNWVAIVPLKQGASQKSRLAQSLDPGQRAALTQALFARVIGALTESNAVSQVIVLSPSDPERPDATWVRDQGRGLNEELMALRALYADRNVLIVHADLPFVDAADIDDLLSAAEVAGIGIAPDKFELGTNALAIRSDSSIGLMFGEQSFVKHRAAAPGAAIVKSRGLSHDIDTPDDLRAALDSGLRISSD
jgi:2-phospho-L-lactate/phosphoenolpyruvate guanylyltransferase